VCALSVQGNGQTVVQAASSSPLCPVVPPGMWTIPVAMCPMPTLTFLPMPVHTNVGLPEVLLSPGSSPRGSPCSGLSFATASAPESYPEVVRPVPMLSELTLQADLGSLEDLASPGSSPRGSLCGRQSFATESTAEGPADWVSEGDEAGLCDDDDEVELWSVRVKNTFVDVTMVDYESASPSSRQRRRSTPAISRARVPY